MDDAQDRVRVGRRGLAGVERQAGRAGKFLALAPVLAGVGLRAGAHPARARRHFSSSSSRVFEIRRPSVLTRLRSGPNRRFLASLRLKATTSTRVGSTWRIAERTP